MALELDLRPALTVWRGMTTEQTPQGPLPLEFFLFRPEGGGLSNDAVERGADYLKSTVSKTKMRYVIIYDLSTPPDEFLAAVPKIVALSNELRPCLERGRSQKLTCIVCANAVVRAVADMVVRLASRVYPVRIVASLEEARFVSSQPLPEEGTTSVCMTAAPAR